MSTLIRTLFLFVLSITVLWSLAASAQEDRPRIAVVSIHLASYPNLALEATEELDSALEIDLFGLGGGLLPSVGDADLTRYDLVLIDGAGPSLLNFAQAIEEAKRVTRVATVDSEAYIAGNIELSLIPDLQTYWDNPTAENYRRMFSYLAAQLLDTPIAVERPIEFPPLAFYHPDAPKPFADLTSYEVWANDRFADGASRPKIGILLYRNLVLGQNSAVVDAIIREVERQGGLPIPVWREGSRSLASGLLPEGYLDAMILCAARLNYFSADEAVSEAQRLGVPLLSCQTEPSRSVEEWEQSNGGFAPGQTGSLALSETEGIVEPKMVGAKTIGEDGTARDTPITDQVEWRVARAMRWAQLHRMANSEKRLVVTFYSEGSNKADVGSDSDTYLDAQGSILALLHRLNAEGYDIGGAALPTRAQLARRMAELASNFDPSDDAEFARREEAGTIALIPEDQYRVWFATLPASLRASIVAVWGPPPGDVMVRRNASDEGTSFVVPVLRYGNVTLAPHPIWGYQKNPEALRRADALPPHHQYLAFYWWMQQQAQADAFVPMFSQISLMPGKQEGPARDDAIGILLGNLPHIALTPLQANGGIKNKRRALATLIGFMPAFAPQDLPPDLIELRAEIELLDGMQADLARVRSLATESGLGAALGIDLDTALRSELVAALNGYLAEATEVPVPIGAHVLGEPPSPLATAKVVAAMLSRESGDRVEPYTVKRALEGDETALDPAVFERARDYAGRLGQASREMDAIIDALDGLYIEPGPMRDAIRNPDALPAGRNPYALDVRALPHRKAWETGKGLVSDLLEDAEARPGSLPRKVAFTLWSGETAQNGGTNEAQILYLLGVRPVWNVRDQVVGVELIPRGELGRPRIDVMVTTSGTYRDHFGEKIILIAQAVQLAAAADEPGNALRESVRVRTAELEREGMAPERARASALTRVFSTAPGAYSPLLEFAIDDPVGSDSKGLSDLYVTRMAHGYGSDDPEAAGGVDVSAFLDNLDTVDAAVFSRSTSAYGVLDTPMVASYLGGFQNAVRQRTGRSIPAYIANLQNEDAARIETLDRFFSREMQTRYLNPAWIRSMQESGYTGARYMTELSSNLLLWDVANPALVSDGDWQRVYDVYVRDRYKLGMTRYFDEANPYARQRMLDTMREAIRRGAWNASAETRAALAAAGGAAVRRTTLAETKPLQVQTAPGLRSVPTGIVRSLAAPADPNLIEGTVAPPPMVGMEMIDVPQPTGLVKSLSSLSIRHWLVGLLFVLLLSVGFARRAKW